jgi:hypothetical protein
MRFEDFVVGPMVTNSTHGRKLKEVYLSELHLEIKVKPGLDSDYSKLGLTWFLE